MATIPSAATQTEIHGLTSAVDDIASVESDVATLEAAVGAYAGENDIATDLVALETAVGIYAGDDDIVTDLAAVEAAVGTDDEGGDLFARVAMLETEDATEYVPLGSLRLSTGAAIAAFANNTTDGYELTGSECLGIRWNDSGSSRITVMGELHIPDTWDDTQAVTLHFEGFRVGAADAAMVLTVTLFAQEVGQAYTADTNAGGNTSAFDGDTNVITDETLTVLAGVLPAGSKVTFTAVPDAALDGDDFVLTGVKFVGKRKQTAA